MPKATSGGTTGPLAERVLSEMSNAVSAASHARTTGSETSCGVVPAGVVAVSRSAQLPLTPRHTDASDSESSNGTRYTTVTMYTPAAATPTSTATVSETRM